MVARIYQPTKNPMQSGRGKAGTWLLEYLRETPRKIEPLMGYTSSGDMKQQIKLSFDSKEDAVTYAERNGIAYQLVSQKLRKVRATSYSDNFKYNRKQAWTH
ncbi:MAG: ETC complex I subunit [Hyphomicrobiales bacterium]